MKILTLDFETYYDKEYSLRRLTTEAYCRDPRFKAHMVGFKIDAGPANVTRDVAGFCAKVDWTQVAGLAHHGQFDGLILKHHYGVAPALWLDTLSMARIVLPGEKHSLHALARRLGFEVVDKVGLREAQGQRELADEPFYWLADDCTRDVDLTYACAMKLMPYVPRDELRAIDLTIRMFTEPVLELDRDRAARFHAKVVEEKRLTLEQLGVIKADLQSSERFAALLRQLGVEPPMKPNAKGEPIYAFAKTDEAMRDLEEHPSNQVQALVSARLGSKSTINETRSKRLLDMDYRGPLCVYLKHAGAHTGRYSGGDLLNWQNLERGGELRKSILAPKGYKIVKADSSQIQCRLVNWMARQDSVTEAFAARRDIYSELASHYYGRTITKEQPTERQLGKTIELACGFGMGRDRFKDTCRRGPFGAPPIYLSDSEAQAAVDVYRSSHQKVVQLWKAADTVLWALAGGKETIWGPCVVRDRAIWLPGGYPLWYRQIDDGANITFADGTTGIPGERYVWTGRAWVKIYGAKLVENVIQGLEAVLIKSAMLSIASRYRTVLQEHDSGAWLAREDDTDALPFVLQELTRVPSWAEGLPLAAEGMEGERYEK